MGSHHDDLIATALDDPQAMSTENKAFRGINFADLQTAYRQFCKNKKVTVPAVDLAEVIDHYTRRPPICPITPSSRASSCRARAWCSTARANASLRCRGEPAAPPRLMLTDLQPGWHCRAAGSRAS